MSESSAQTSSAPGEGGSSPSIVSRKVGAGIQARLARLQGAAGAAVVAREVPKRFANGYDEPFRERLDGTLRRSLSGTWSVHALEADASSASTDGSQTLIDVQTSATTPSLPTVAEAAELKRRRDFTKSWEKEQEAVADQLLSPEPPRIQMSPQPIMEEPEPEEEEVKEKVTEKVVLEEKPSPVTPAPVPAPAPATVPATVQDDPKHGILTPPISEPEIVSTPVRKTEPKLLVRPHTTSTATRLRPPPPPQPQFTSVTSPPKTPTPIRQRPRASAPSASTLAPPMPRMRLTPSPAKPPARASLAPPRAQTSMGMMMSSRRASAPTPTPGRLFSSRIPPKVLPPPVRPRTISKVYEGPTISSLGKQRPSIGGMASRAVSRAGFS